MSRTKRFVSGLGFGYANQVLTTLVAFWLTPFLLQRIGEHDYGLWLVGTQLMFYLGLLDLGIVALLPRETAFATGRASSIERAEDLPVIIGQTVRLIIWQMPLVAGGALVAWLMLPAAWEGLRNPIGVVLMVFVVIFPLRIFNAVLTGLQDFAFLGRMSIASYLAAAAATLTLVLAGWGLYALAVGWAVQQLIAATTGWYRLRTNFPMVLPRSLPEMPWTTARKRLTQGSWVSLSQIAQVLVYGTDVLIIGKVFGPAAVVPFVITGKLIGVLSNQPQMLTQLAGPALSEMRMAESRDRLSQVCIALSQAVLMVSGVVVCVVLAINQGFVGRWVGADHYGGSLLTVLLLLSMLLRHWNLTVGYALFAFGFEKRLCLTALLDGLVSIGAVVLFVSFYGLIGAPLGIMTGVCIISLPLNLSGLARENKLSLWALVKPLLPWFTRFFALGLVSYVLAKIWTPHTLPLVAVTAAACVLVYAAVTFPLALRAPLGIYVRPRLRIISDRLFGVANCDDSSFPVAFFARARRQWSKPLSVESATAEPESLK